MISAPMQAAKSQCEIVGEWRSWSDCSVTTGTGSRTRTRWVLGVASGTALGGTQSLHSRRLLTLDNNEAPAQRHAPVPRPLPYRADQKAHLHMDSQHGFPRSHSRRLLRACTATQLAPRCSDMRCVPASCCNLASMCRTESNPPPSLLVGTAPSLQKLACMNKS